MAVLGGDRERVGNTLVLGVDGFCESGILRALRKEGVGVGSWRGWLGASDGGVCSSACRSPVVSFPGFVRSSDCGVEVALGVVHWGSPLLASILGEDSAAVVGGCSCRLLLSAMGCGNGTGGGAGRAGWEPFRRFEGGGRSFAGARRLDDEKNQSVTGLLRLVALGRLGVVSGLFEVGVCTIVGSGAVVVLCTCVVFAG